MTRVHHENYNSGNRRGISFGCFPKNVESMALGKEIGIYKFEDFLGCPSAPSDPFRTFTLSDNGSSETGETGEMSISTDGTDNDFVYIASPKIAALSDVTGDDDEPFGGEFRIKLDSIAAIAVVMGFTIDPTAVLSNGSIAATNEAILLFADASNLAPKAYYADGSTSTQFGSASEDSLAADTYMKLGLSLEQKYDGTGPRFKAWVNGKRIGQFSNSELTMSSIASGVIFCGVQATAAAAKKMTWDFAAYYTQQ